jgi:hypothetical protein
MIINKKIGIIFTSVLVFISEGLIWMALAVRNLCLYYCAPGFGHTHIAENKQRHGTDVKWIYSLLL